MASEYQIGKYKLVFENKQLRLQRPPAPGERPLASPVLRVTLIEAGKAPVLFLIDRIVQSGEGAIEIHGNSSELVSLDGHISYDAATDGLLCRLHVENMTHEMQMRLSVQLVLHGEADPRWLVPGFFYADNRPQGNTRYYPSFSEITPDTRRMISSSWAIRSDRAATPLSCVWTYQALTFIATDNIFGRLPGEPGGIGMTGLNFGMEDGVPAVGVDFPYHEFPLKFSFCHEDRTEPEETYLLLPERTPLEVTFRCGLFQPDLHGYARVMRGLYDTQVERDRPMPEMAAETAEHLAHRGLLRWHFDNRAQAIYENATFDRHFGRKGNYLERGHMHAGWLSGILAAYTLLWAGRETNHGDSVAAGQSVINKFASKLSPCGTIFPVWTEEHGWSCSYGPEKGVAHSRTVAEGVYFILRALGLEMGFDGRHPQWVDAALSSLNYAMGAQREDGCFPVYYDLTVGRVATYEGTGGLAWMAAFVLGASLTQRAHYLDVARRAGDFYARYVRNTFLYGSVEDQPLTPSCDDCHWALISYLALYETDRDLKWLNLARQSADLALTWRMSYNVDFEPATLLGRYGFRTCGGDISSVATPILGCQGLVAYRELVKLSVYTGDPYYRRRAEDSRMFSHQLIVAEDGQYNGREGMVAGQVFHTDWWQPKGVMLSLSYAISASLVKYAELLRRNMVLGEQTIEWARGANAGEIPMEPVLYVPVEHSAPPAMPAGESRESSSGYLAPPFGGGDPNESSISGSIARILGMREGQSAPRQNEPIPSLPPRGGGERGFSTDQVPLAGFEQKGPVPFPDTGSASRDPDSEKDGNEDSEIKYKIF